MNKASKYNAIYGPVNSWRYGSSLGVDVICGESTCSFNCIYCQLGSIMHVTSQRKVFVETDKVIEDFQKSNWQKAEIITFSGSGEPTLALNLGEIIKELKTISNKPILVLTNSTLLIEEAVIKDLSMCSKVSAKLDVYNDKALKLMNRPASEITIDRIVNGIKNLRKNFKGKLSVQTMLMHANLSEIDHLISIIKEIKPDELELNTPTRPYPLTWDISNRGRSPSAIEKRTLKKLEEEKMQELLQKFQSQLDIPIITPYLA